MASALGVRVVLPGLEGAVSAGVSAPPDASGESAQFAFGDAVVTGPATTSAWAVTDEQADAAASATVESVSLFGGEITAQTVSVRAGASASELLASGGFEGSFLSGLLVLGAPVEATPNARVPLGDWGYAVLLEQAVSGREAAAHSHRGSVTGIHVHLLAEHGGLPAGTDILVGFAEAGARAPRGAAVEGASAGPAALALPHPREPKAKKRERRFGPPAIVRRPPPEIRPRLTYGGYVFPVYGKASFSNDFGAPRALTVWHHGNDIYAPVGAPALAVADGELFLVGWNRVGGWRLWLRDELGNEFYYAHLSAFSPVAFEGSRVRAGDVVGFVGATGDAVGTPSHLHFEIHPAQLLGLGYDGVVNPYRYLRAWSRLDDVRFDVGSGAPAPGKAPPAAAVLLDADDISSVSGLDPAALEQVLAVPELFGERVERPGPLVRGTGSSAPARG